MSELDSKTYSVFETHPRGLRPTTPKPSLTSRTTYMAGGSLAAGACSKWHPL